jgi:hypothetical protein
LFLVEVFLVFLFEFFLSLLLLLVVEGDCEGESFDVEFF